MKIAANVSLHWLDTDIYKYRYLIYNYIGDTTNNFPQTNFYKGRKTIDKVMLKLEPHANSYN